MKNDLRELYDYLVTNGVLVEPTRDSVSAYDYEKLRAFKQALNGSYSTELAQRLRDIADDIGSLVSDVEDVADELDQQ